MKLFCLYRTTETGVVQEDSGTLWLFLLRNNLLSLINKQEHPKEENERAAFLWCQGLVIALSSNGNRDCHKCILAQNTSQAILKQGVLQENLFISNFSASQLFTL